MDSSIWGLHVLFDPLLSCSPLAARTRAECYQTMKAFKIRETSTACSNGYGTEMKWSE